jgi:hypothetical protein
MLEHSKPNITKPEANQTARPDGSSGENARRDTTRPPRRRTASGSHITSDNPRNVGASRKGRAILALLQHGNREKSAQEVGVHPVTLWRWTQEPKFQQALQLAHRQVYLDSIGRLQQGTHAAVETLLDVMADKHAPAGARVRAAHNVMALSHDGLQFEDLVARITQLERIAGETQTQK